MSNRHDLNRRLTTAKHEAADADRVWRVAMAQHARNGSDDSVDCRRRLDALWQERERAHLRVLELQWLCHSKLQRTGGLAARVRGARGTLSVLCWYVGERLRHQRLRATFQ